MIRAADPTFSIVIPTYNNDAQLMQCLHALSQQNVESSLFEIIVVNDGGNEKLIKKMKADLTEVPIRYYYQVNKGPAAARNLGISKAMGEIILFLDDDSLPRENWLQATINAWKEHPKYDGIGGYTSSRATDSILSSVNKDIFNWYLNKNVDKENCSFLSTHNAGYKKCALERVGMFDERFKKASGEDRNLNRKIVDSGGKLRLDRSIYVYHDREISLKSFMRKYYNYGKAAFEISSGKLGGKHSSLSDYFSLFDSVLKQQTSLVNKLTAFIILMLSQASTLIGYQKAALFR
jgi:glycosyltransferase involved in cell wall biosynthesis